MKSKSLTAAVSLLLVYVAGAFAQDEQLRIRSVSIPRAGEITVAVEPPPGATPQPSDFDLMINGERAATAREAQEQGLNVTLLVDVSGSMQGPPLDDTKKALISFLGKTRSKDQFQLISFADDDHIESSFKETRQHLESAIDGLETKGKKTVLFQALDKALEESRRSKSRNQMFIVISDGKDEGSPEKYSKVIQKSIKDSGIPIHTIFRGKITGQVGRVLYNLADATGGRYAPAQNEDEILSALTAAYGSVPRSFIVHFSYEPEPSGKTADGAVIVWNPANAGELRGDIRDKLAAVVPIPPKKPRDLSWWLEQPNIFWWLLPLLLGGLLLGAFVWARRGGTKVTRSEPIVVPPRKEIKPTPAERQSPLGETRIAHYFPVPSAGHPAATLLGVGGAIEGRQFFIDRETLRIGASAENEVEIAEDEYVSADHAYLHYEKGSLRIFDQGSRNGTFVNEQKLAEHGSFLRPGDRIRVGTSILEVAPADR